MQTPSGSLSSAAIHPTVCMKRYFDGLVQERHNSIANAVELRLSCTKASIWCCNGIQEVYNGMKKYTYWTTILIVFITPLHSTPLHSTPLHSTPLHSTPLHSTPLHSTPLHSTPPIMPCYSMPCHTLPYLANGYMSWKSGFSNFKLWLCNNFDIYISKHHIQI